ncbi:MAG TPA: hypothetical protein VJ938_03930 [Acidimicrobiia bacterium]|nr:hypothetical protein [Acidimicrobiia bacterium]
MTERPPPGLFFDTRAAYLLFATATSEKTAVAERIGRELDLISPKPPGLRVFDAGMGDASVLTQLMREMHQVYPHIPWAVVGKEISLEDVRQALSRLPDRLFEHPEMVFVVTNLRFSEAPQLAPTDATDLVWREVSLTGDTSHDFAAQLGQLLPFLASDWEVTTSPETGNPVYVRPSVLIVYRQDHEFMLRPLIPHLGEPLIGYDLIISAQAYRAAAPLHRKVATVLSPLARALAPGGRLVGIQSRGRDPGMEIVRRVWPDLEPFGDSAADVVAEARRQLADTDLEFPELDPDDAVVRYEMHTMPSESAEHIGTSSVLATWNAAAYVAQIDESRLSEAMRSGAWERATREVMARHPTVWFEDEVFVISRPDGSL